MTTKTAVIATVAIVIGAMVLGLAGLFLFSRPSPRNAEMLGQGVALLIMIPIGVIWILWADRFRKERERNKGR